MDDSAADGEPAARLCQVSFAVAGFEPARLAKSAIGVAVGGVADVCGLAPPRGDCDSPPYAAEFRADHMFSWPMGSSGGLLFSLAGVTIFGGMGCGSRATGEDSPVLALAEPASDAAGKFVGLVKRLIKSAQKTVSKMPTNTSPNLVSLPICGLLLEALFALVSPA